jgi:predicted dehydrogenase
LVAAAFEDGGDGLIRFGVIGYGYWGPNIVRNIAETQGAEMVSVSDLRPERLALAKRRYPAIRVTVEQAELLLAPDIDVVVISTPVHTHFQLAMQALEAGKHVIIEKPLTASSEEAMRLIEAAQARRLQIMVDHTFIYTAAVCKIRELLDSRTLGEVYYYDSVRVNLGLFQADVNVIWDLAVHDLAIMDYLLGCQPTAVSATGFGHVTGRPENIAYITLFFAEPLIAHIHVNWLSPVKVRSTLIGGSERMIVYDDVEANEKVKIYDRGITVTPGAESAYKAMIGYRLGDIWAPRLDNVEALGVEFRHYVHCLETGEQPKTGGLAGLRVVRILEAASESMQRRGELVELKAQETIA